jgi:hypothetical protein
MRSNGVGRAPGASLAREPEPASPAPLARLLDSKGVDRDAVLAFHSKLADIGNISGVMVSRAGFQRGTREFAAHASIDIRTMEDLPTFRETLAMRVASVCMPDALKRPEPFWCLQAKDGSYYAQPHSTSGEIVIPLFISELDAEATKQLRAENALMVPGRRCTSSSSACC